MLECSSSEKTNKQTKTQLYDDAFLLHTKDSVKHSKDNTDHAFH